MDSDRWNRIQALFHDAAEYPAGAWRAFLEDVCPDDPEMVGEVLALLGEDARRTSLLERAPLNHPGIARLYDAHTLDDGTPWFFGGLDVAETAELLDVSEATILRDWRAAKAWLAKEIKGQRPRSR